MTGNNWLAIKGLARVAHTQVKIADWVQTIEVICNKKFVCAAIGAGVLMVSAANFAQTEPTYEIQTSQPDLEQEYRDELDKWMLRAYEGDRDAQFKVGVLFTNDQFGPPDFEQAVYWYKQAARQGHVLAQYNLGHQYLTGIGVAKSDESAMQWWLEAAKQDHALAQFNVGRAFYLGIGLPEDHVRSKYWFERAASNQEPKSIDILRQLGWWDGQLASRDSELEGGADQPVIANAGPVNEAGQDISGDDNALTSKIVPIESNTEDSQPQSTATSGTSIGDSAWRTGPVTVEDLPAAAASAAPSQAAPDTAPAQQQPQQPAVTPELQKNPIALYTNPAVRSVLIAILDERDTLTELERRGEWATVQSNVGFPVWVHGDFLSVRGDVGTINGEAVNARSVPIITNGTVVGKLDKDESVAILDQRKNWYRVVAPARFKAWAKVTDMDRTPPVSDSVATNTTLIQPQTTPVQTASTVDSTAEVESQVATQSETGPEEAPAQEVAASPPAGTLGMINDNDWLFGQPADHYTLQLASFDDLAKVEEFISRSKFYNNPELHRFTARGKNIEWTYFLYGSYSERSAAESAKLQINQKLAWVRTFGRLQQNRCVSWKTKLPTPKELNRYCTQ